MIDQGGVKLDGEKLSDKALKLKAGETVVASGGQAQICARHDCLKFDGA